MVNKEFWANWKKANELNKTNICMCDNPKVESKNSENGHSVYCGVCLKDFKGLKGSYKGE